MADNAIGLIETKGYVAALAAGDAMVKAANVTIVGRQEVGDGLVSVTIVGDVAKLKRLTSEPDDKTERFAKSNDEAERYATGNLREVYFYRSQLIGHTEREYHPGN